MNFLKKLFNIPDKEKEEVVQQNVNLSLDDLFVHNFLNKGGKFLYCVQSTEVQSNLARVLAENKWDKLYLLTKDLKKFVNKKEVSPLKTMQTGMPVFTTCEHLIADNGDILFSSNQLKSTKLNEMPDDFIVFATTSQIVKDTGQGLTGIKRKNKDNLPTNISSIRNYQLNNSDDSFLNYGNSNSKNLYLLLLEDL
ncbi:MAG: hypothetical protein CMB99_05210 [Flavobacteriaceae bacterium]|nr:hypothetical protein [Flavobacteriaceae bacterium]|tara:strand:- start:60375 stop:60959 length:585 start_codon:yes stop_codon:yes gene_type:complete